MYPADPFDPFWEQRKIIKKSFLICKNSWSLQGISWIFQKKACWFQHKVEIIKSKGIQNQKKREREREIEYLILISRIRINLNRKKTKQ